MTIHREVLRMSSHSGQREGLQIKTSAVHNDTAQMSKFVGVVTSIVYLAMMSFAEFSNEFVYSSIPINRIS